MATPGATLPRAADGTREIPHTVSPGLWTLAWRRLRADRVGMVSLVIVFAFVVMMILSGLGLVAKDWSRRVLAVGEASHPLPPAPRVLNRQARVPVRPLHGP